MTPPASVYLGFLTGRPRFIVKLDFQCPPHTMIYSCFGDSGSGGPSTRLSTLTRSWARCSSACGRATLTIRPASGTGLSTSRRGTCPISCAKRARSLRSRRAYKHKSRPAFSISFGPRSICASMIPTRCASSSGTCRIFIVCPSWAAGATRACASGPRRKAVFRKTARSKCAV